MACWALWVRPGRDAADAGDVADGDGGRRHARWRWRRRCRRPVSGSRWRRTGPAGRGGRRGRPPARPAAAVPPRPQPRATARGPAEPAAPAATAARRRLSARAGSRRRPTVVVVRGDRRSTGGRAAPWRSRPPARGRADGRRPGPGRRRGRSGASRRPRRGRRGGATERRRRRAACRRPGVAAAARRRAVPVTASAPRSLGAPRLVEAAQDALEPVDRAHDGQRVAAVLLDLAHAPGAVHQHAAADHQRHAEQAARDEIGHLLVEVRAVRCAVPAEQDADEAEDDEPTCRWSRATCARCVRRGPGGPGRPRRPGAAGASGTGVAVGSAGGRRDASAAPDGDARRRTPGGRPGVTRRRARVSDDRPKSFISWILRSRSEVVGGGGEALHERVAVRAGLPSSSLASSARL